MMIRGTSCSWRSFHDLCGMRFLTEVFYILVSFFFSSTIALNSYFISFQSDVRLHIHHQVLHVQLVTIQFDIISVIHRHLLKHLP